MLRLGSTALLIAALVAVPPISAHADKQNHQITTSERMDLVRGLEAEYIFIRRTFPMGDKGLTLKDGKITPDENGVRNAVAAHGLAARPGDKAQITNMEIRDKSIVFEINGGPKKHTKWYQHISVGVNGADHPIGNAPEGVARGSVLTLAFDRAVPDLTVDQVKKLLAPVFDFTPHSAAELYAKQFPPEVQQALKDHKILVGMNKELVEDAKGRPDQRLHEKDAQGQLYEEWIYGTPPQEVQFVRFNGDEVSRLEIMQVDGQKVVRTAKEIDLKAIEAERERAAAAAAAEQPGGAASPNSAVASQAPANPADIPDEAKGPKGRPSLRRPGEQPQDPATEVSNTPMPRSPDGATMPNGAPPGSDGKPDPNGIPIPQSPTGTPIPVPTSRPPGACPNPPCQFGG